MLEKFKKFGLFITLILLIFYISNLFYNTVFSILSRFIYFNELNMLLSIISTTIITIIFYAIVIPKIKKETLNLLENISLFILLFIFFLFIDYIYVIPLAFLGIDINTLSYNIQTLLSLFSSFVLAIIIIVIYKNYLKEKLIDFKKNFKNYFDDGMKYWFIGLVGMCITNLLIATFSPVNEANNEVLVQEMLELSPILSFISATFFAPFLEEMLFRKSLGDIFKNKKIMVIISGVIFGALHVIFSLKTPWDLLYIVPYGILGSAFAYMLFKYDNVYVPISFHMLHNGMLTLISILPTILGLGA